MRRSVERRLWSAWREQRDEAAFEQLVEPHLPFAIDLARRLGCDAHDADDLAQQALAALAATRDDRPTEVGVRAWIGRRVSLGVKTLRRSQHRRSVHEDRALPPSAATTAVAEIDNRDAVDAALARLAPDERQAIVLRFLHDLEYREVAYVLGISPLAARLRVHRSLAILRARLGRNASALIATGALWTGAKSAHALVGGVLLMSTSVKVTLVAGVILVVALLSFQAVSPNRGETGRAPERATLPHETIPAPPAPQPSQPDAPPIVKANAAIEPTDRETWSNYESTRAMARLAQQTRQLMESVKAIAPGETEPDPQPDTTARLYIEELIARYRTVEGGSARLDVLVTALAAHRRYALQTHDLGFLPFFDDVLMGGPEREQEAVAGALDGLGFRAVVDLLVRAVARPDAAVRAEAVGSLADVRGDDAERAHRAVVAALADPAESVRWSAAIAIEFSCGSPNDVPAVLDQIGREEHTVAMRAMIQAVRTLDPSHGDSRIDDVLSAASAPVRTAVERARKHEPSAGPLAAPTATKKPDAPAPPKTDSPTRDYLERLGEELLALPEGAQREKKFETFASTHADYLRRTRSADLLPMLRRLVERSVSSEQRSLIGSLGLFPPDPIVDQLVEWTSHSQGPVRSSAARSLLLATRNRKPRARKAAIALLDDPDHRVRLEVAMSLMLANDPTLATVLIERLAQETEFTVVYAIVLTATAMDPKARERIEESVESMPSNQAALVRRALATPRR